MLSAVIWAMYISILYVTVFQIIVLLEKDELKPETNWLEEWPTLTIAVPAYNEEDTIEMTLESILSADYPREKLEVVVIDDGSTDNTADKVRDFSAEHDISFIQQENKGKGAALNHALEESDSEFFACVDADSRLKENSLKNIVSDFDEDSAAVASAMKVYEPENILQRIQWVEYMVGIFNRSIMAHIDSIHVTPGPLSIYRREVLEEVGGFDEESRVEDQEICLRLQQEHWKVEHSRKGEVYTVAPSSLRSLYNQRKRWYRGSLENIWKYKNMIFNSEYGEFGFFALPSKVVMGLLSIITVFLISFLTFRPLADLASDFAELGWSFFNFSGQFSLRVLLNEIYWTIISTRITTNMLLISVFALSLVVTYLAGKHTEERLLGQGLFPALIYLAWFVFFIGFMWLVVAAKIIADAVMKLR